MTTAQAHDPWMPAVRTTQRGSAADFAQLMKPRVTLLVVFPAMVGMHLAPGSITLARAVATLVGTVLLVGSANALNCVLERVSDGLMSRTRTRPLPAGRMLATPATLFGLVLLLVALPLLWWAGPLTLALGLLAHVVYVALYTPLKSRTAWSTFVGFGPGAMPALLGWTAVSQQLDWPGVMLFALVFAWQIPHTLAIGLFRGEDYANAGIHVVPNRWGAQNAARTMVLASLVLLPVSLSLVALDVVGPVYGVVAALLGLVQLGLAVQGLLGAVTQHAWARRVFFFTMAYLTLVMCVMAADKVSL